MPTTQIELFTAQTPIGGMELWRSDGATNQQLASFLMAPPVYLDGTAYFCTWDGLWRSDGTTAGTVRISDLHGELAVAGYQVYLLTGGAAMAMDGRLYRIDAGAPVQVTGDTDADGQPRMDTSGISGEQLLDIYVAGNALYLKTSAGGMPMLHHWNGTSADPAGYPPLPYDMQLLPSSGDTLFFTGTGPNYSGYGVWAADLAGLHFVHDFGDSWTLQQAHPVVRGDFVYYTKPVSDPSGMGYGTGSPELFRATLDGSEQQLTFGTTTFDQWYTPHYVGNDVANLQLVDNALVYTRRSPQSTDLVQKTDIVKLVGGTQYDAGTEVTLWTASASAIGTELTATTWQGELVFVANSDEAGPTGFSRHFLMRSGAGTDPASVITELPPDFNGAQLQVARVGSTWYFAGGGTNGIQLYQVENGILSAVSAVDGGFISIGALNVVGDKLLFDADDGVHGKELWVSDGTAAGTMLAHEFDAGASPDAAFWPRDFSLSAADTFYTTNDSHGRLQVWHSHAGGAAQEVDLGGLTDPWSQAVAAGDGALYISAIDGSGLRSAFRVDAGGITGMGQPGASGSVNGSDAQVLGDALFWSGWDGTTMRLFRGDASGIGMMVVDSAGHDLANVHALRSAGGRLYFVANDASDGTAQIFRADGAVTQLTHRAGGVQDWPHALQDVQVVGGTEYFDIGNDVLQLENGVLTELGANAVMQSRYTHVTAPGSAALVVADGQAFAWNAALAASAAIGSDFSVTDVTQAGSSLFFTATEYSNAASRAALFRIDGGTVTRLAGFGTGTGDSSYDIANSGDLVAVGDAVYAVDATGRLLRADASGVTQLSVDGPDLKFFQAADLHAAGGFLYFTARDFANGRELWRTDGTAAGTMRVSQTDAPNDGAPDHFQSFLVDAAPGDATAPTVVAAQTFAYTENSGPGAVLGHVQASDDTGVTGFRFENGSATSDDGFFAIADDGTLTLTAAGGAGAANDYETLPNVFAPRVQARDAAGNWSAATGIALQVTDVDDTAPVVAANQEIAYFEGRAAGAVLGTVAASDNVWVAQLQFAGGGATSPDGLFALDASGKVSLTALGAASAANAYGQAPNQFTYAVQAVDGAGNVSAAVDFTLRERPVLATPVITGLAAGSDSGRSASDGITKVTAPTVTGTGPAGASITVYDNNAVVGAAVVQAGGTWSVKLTLGAGNHSLSADASDGSGAGSLRSDAYALRIDTTAPAAPAGMLVSSDAGTVARSGVTGDATLVLSGTAEAGGSVQVLDNGVAIGAVLADSGGAWSMNAGTEAAPLAEGLHTFSARATDVAGNVGASASYAVTVDLQPPAAPVIGGLAAGSDTGASATDGVTRITSPTVVGTADAGSTVQVYLDGAWSATATASSTGAWSARVGNLEDRAYQVTARALDKAGNASGMSDAFTVTVDHYAYPAPAFWVQSDPGQVPAGGVTPDQTLQVHVTGYAGATLELFDGTTLLARQAVTADGEVVLAAGTADAPLADGRHSLVARITDLAGNSASSSAFQLTVDTTGPAAAVLTGLGAGTDSGASASDGITRVTAPVLTGLAEAGASVAVFRDGTQVGTATASTTGAWSLKLPSLGDSSYALTAMATDKVGNSGALSAPFTLVVDTTAPVKPAVNVLSDAGLLAANATTNDNKLDLYGTAEANARIDLLDGSTLLGTVAAGDTGFWSVAAGSVLQPLADGKHMLNVRATDAAGNQSTSSFGVTVKTQPPPVPTLAGLADASDTGLKGDAMTRLTLPALAGTAQPGVTVRLYENDGLIGSGKADAAGNWTARLSLPLSYGEHAITATAVDAAGNESAGAAPATVILDNLAPLTPSIGVEGAHGNIGSGGWTPDTVLSVDVLTEGLVQVDLYDGTTRVATGASDAFGHATLWAGIDSPLAQGTHSFTVRATDDAGNVSTSAPIRATVDSLAPAVPAIAGLTAGTDTGASNSDGITRVTTPSLTGTAEAGSTVHVYDGVDEIGSVVASSGGAWTLRTPVLSEGPHAFTVEAIDRTGNASGRSDAKAIVIDTLKPVAPTLAVADANGNTVASGATNLPAGGVVVTVSAEAGSAVVLRDNSVATAPVVADDAGHAVFTVASLPFGSHKFQAVSTDAAGNASSSSIFSVSMPNHLPASSGPLGAQAWEGIAAASLDVLSNWSDPDGSPLSFVATQALPAGVSYDAASHSLRLDTGDAAYAGLVPGQIADVVASYGISDGSATVAAQASWQLHGAATMDFTGMASQAAYAEEGLQATSWSGYVSGSWYSGYYYTSVAVNDNPWTYQHGDGSSDVGIQANGIDAISFTPVGGGRFGIDRIGTIAVTGAAILVGYDNGVEVAHQVVDGSTTGPLQLGPGFASVTNFAIEANHYSWNGTAASATLVGVDDLHWF